MLLTQSIACIVVLCCVLQSGGDMSNDENLADKLSTLLQTALRAHQSNTDLANNTSFKRLAGAYDLLTTLRHNIT